MMGRGAEGGCGAEEKPCPISRAPTKFLHPKEEEPAIVEKKAPIEIDFYTQARKALCERSPFDTEDAQVSTNPTLPTGLANLLSRNPDSRKRQKKSHAGAEAKSSQAGGVEKVRGSKLWAQTEDYFRELTVDDIDKLQELSSLNFPASRKCISVPVRGNALGENRDIIAIEVNANGGGSDCGMVVKEEEVVQFMEVDSVGANNLPQEKPCCSPSSQLATPSSGLEWLLGARGKIHLTSERPSKKRKLLGGDAGLEKLLVACPVDGSSSLCHYCSFGDTGNQLNRLLVCSSCNVAVHQNCYGVQDNVAGSWLCSWCKLKNSVQLSERPCVLCPRIGGALKRVSKRGIGSDGGGSPEFAHLFCCQWMPEVYVQDTRTMEPIVNLEGIKETRRKLICYLCKVKCGAGVRCSNGTCRTSFHPICAREARHRMEIWAKFGCDDVELRAFCSKHSELQNGSCTQQSGDMSVPIGYTMNRPATPIVNKPQKLKIARKNGDKMTVHFETTDHDINKLGNSVLHGEGLSDTRSSFRESECGDSQQPANTEAMDRDTRGDAKTSETPDFTVILKKLIDRGKVHVNEVALEIGVSPDSLASMLADNFSAPDLRCKTVTWLRHHGYIDTLQKNVKVKIKSSLASTNDMGDAKDADDVMVSESYSPDVVPAKSVPPRRRTQSNMSILKDDNVVCLLKEMVNSDGEVLGEARRDQLICEDAYYSSKEVVSDVTDKKLVELDGVRDTLASSSPKREGGQAQGAALSEQHVTPNSGKGNAEWHVIKDIPDLIKGEEADSSSKPPLVHKETVKLQDMVLSDNPIFQCGGSTDRENTTMDASSSFGICCSHSSGHISSSDVISKCDGTKLDQLIKARKLGVLEMSPEDEVEGELIFQQHRLLRNAVARKRSSDDLICKVVKNLPQETDAVGKRQWDSVLVNQYLSDLREAKKQGRKERRHKEAQAVLAAATAAAAASLRISSRKDMLDESAHHENLLKVNTSTGRPGISSQQMLRTRETLTKLAVPRVSSEVKSDFGHLVSDFSKEHPRSCDICRRSETILNAILVCSSCKVAVHLDCYRGVKDSTGPWYCELCEDLLSSRSSVAPAVNTWERPYFAAECGLCGGSAGAFRKSADGQWVHAFCAEWVLESTFRRGQVNPVQGMESILKGNDVCDICTRKQGICTKCNYGHCQHKFHPSCARSAGFYMNVKTAGGKLQHKAYCEKHSLEQRAKAETQRHGTEDLKSLKQIRVELERLRLLCERIVKREKLKRELVLCSQEILGSNRDSVAFSARFRTPFFPADVSSESATTSLKRNTDDCRSGSEAIQRSDELTVDSAVSGKRRIKFPVSVDNDEKTDDSSTSEHLFILKPKERVSFAGKQIPHRPSYVAPQNISDDAEKRSKYKKHMETFEKELVMTSDQASLKNQRLPKGFVYVPIQCLPKEKETIPDAYCGKRLERDGKM